MNPPGPGDEHSPDPPGAPSSGGGADPARGPADDLTELEALARQFAADDGTELAFGDEPISGWRANNVVVDASRRRAWLVGVHHQRRYGAHASAVCDVEDHAAPATGCHCGLHAWPTRDGAEAYRRQWGQQALCRVELEGEVICHGEPGTEEVEGYRASHMTTLGVEFADRCWRCSRRAVALAPVDDGQGRFRVAFGQPEGLAELRPVCERCRRSDSLGCADVAAMLGTEVRLAGVEPVESGVFGRLQEVFSRGPMTFLLSAGVLLTVAVFGMVGAIVEGSLVTGVLFGATTLAALVGGLLLATGRGGRRLGLAIAAVTVAFLVAGPLIATISQTTGGLPARSEAVLAALDGELPAADTELTRRLTEAGATSVQVADIDPAHKAVAFVVDGRCYQAGVTTDDDPADEVAAGAWHRAGTQSTGVALAGACPPAYPVVGDGTVGGGEPGDAPSEPLPLSSDPVIGSEAAPTVP